MLKLRFGPLQIKIMRLLWEYERLNAREIADHLNKKEQVAHSTVQTILRELERKGSIDHDIDYRTFVFYPIVKIEDSIEDVARNFAENYFSGSTGGLVSYFIKNDFIPPEEMKELKELINKKD